MPIKILTQSQKSDIIHQLESSITCKAIGSVESIFKKLTLSQRLEVIRTDFHNAFPGWTPFTKACQYPEALKVILDLVPQDQLFEAVKGSVTQMAAYKNPLKVFLELLTEDQWFEAVTIKNHDGKSLLYQASDSSPKGNEVRQVILDSLPIKNVSPSLEQQNQTDTLNNEILRFLRETIQRFVIEGGESGEKHLTELRHILAKLKALPIREKTPYLQSLYNEKSRFSNMRNEVICVLLEKYKALDAVSSRDTEMTSVFLSDSMNRYRFQTGQSMHMEPYGADVGITNPLV